MAVLRAARLASVRPASRARRRLARAAHRARAAMHASPARTVRHARSARAAMFASHARKVRRARRVPAAMHVRRARTVSVVSAAAVVRA